MFQNLVKKMRPDFLSHSGLRNHRNNIKSHIDILSDIAVAVVGIIESVDHFFCHREADINGAHKIAFTYMTVGYFEHCISSPRLEMVFRLAAGFLSLFLPFGGSCNPDSSFCRYMTAATICLH